MIEEEFENWIEKDEKKIICYKSTSEMLEYQLGDIEITQIPVKKEQVKDIKIEIDYEKELQAPIRKDTIIGNIKVFLKDEILLKTKIHLKKEIMKKNIWDYLQDFCVNYTNYLTQEIKTM